MSWLHDGLGYCARSRAMFTRGREKTFTGLTSSSDQQQQEQKPASLTNFERNLSGLSNLAAPGPAAQVMREHTHTNTLTYIQTH